MIDDYGNQVKLYWPHFEHLDKSFYRFGRSGTLIALFPRHTYEHHPPTMLARYNLRGQEASDSSGAFFFAQGNLLYYKLASPDVRVFSSLLPDASREQPTRSTYPAIMVFGRLRTFGALNVAL